MAIDWKGRLSRMTAAATTPVLDDAALTDLLLQFRIRDVAGNLPYANWQPLSPYQVTGAIRIPSTTNGHIYRVQTIGVSGSAEPTWPLTASGTVADGTVVWIEAGPYLWQETYSLRGAAAEGWRQKAGMVTPNFDVSVGAGLSFPRSQVQKMCLAMADYYSRGVTGSLQVGHEAQVDEIGNGRGMWSPDFPYLLVNG